MLVHINSLLMRKQYLHYPYLKVFLSSSSSLTASSSASIPSIPPILESSQPLSSASISSSSSSKLSKNKNSLLQVLRSKLKKSIHEDTITSKLNETQIEIIDNVSNIIKSNKISTSTSTSTIISSVMNTVINQNDDSSSIHSKINSNNRNNNGDISNNRKDINIANSIEEDITTTTTTSSSSNDSIVHKNVISLLPSESIIISDFYKLGLSSEIITALYNQNINQPTPVQKQVIPRLLNRENLLMAASTGIIHHHLCHNHHHLHHDHYHDHHHFHHE